MKLQPSKKSSSSSSANAAGSRGSLLGHPCFNCGLMFASKAHYDQHMLAFHDPKLSCLNFVCSECGASFPNPDDLESHVVDHDMGRIILALYLDAKREREGQPSILLPLSAEAQDGEDLTSAIQPSHQEVAVPEIAQPHQTTPTNVVPQVETSEAGPSTADTSRSRVAARPKTVSKPHKASPEKTVKEKSPQKSTPSSSSSRHKKSKSHKRKATSPPSHPVPEPKSSRITRSKEEIKPEPKVPKLTIKARNPPEVVESRTAPASAGTTGSRSSSRNTNPPPPVPDSVPSTSNGASAGLQTQPLLGSKCLFCSLDFPKPWELVCHMADLHGVKLDQITKTEVTDFSEDIKKYNRGKCPFCTKNFPTTQQCLQHILREHRLSLFCSTQSDARCVIAIEMTQQVGDEQKKYTVSVRVRRAKKD